MSEPMSQLLLAAQDFTMLCLKQLDADEYKERCDRIATSVPPERIAEFFAGLPDALSAGSQVAILKNTIAEETGDERDALYVPQDAMQWPASLVRRVQEDPVLKARLTPGIGTLQ